MTKTFFKESEKLREEIRERITKKTEGIKHPKIRNIVMQRNSTSSFLKGILAHHIHEGVGGKYSSDQKLELATGIEIFCSGGALLDNTIDGHEERNGRTTYLREYGTWMQLAASQYVLHSGLKVLMPFLENYSKNYYQCYRIDEAVLGMVGMDIERSNSLEEQITAIEKSNGIFNEVPLVMAATTGTKDDTSIEEVGKYGFNLGAGFAIYEEIKDLLGEHGRRRATEIESNRFITSLHLAKSLDPDFKTDSYLGKKLDDREYNSLIKDIVNNRALERSVELVEEYFNKANASLFNAVNFDCYQQLVPLTDSALQSLHSLKQKTEKKYDQ